MHARPLGCPYTSVGGELRKGKTPHPRVVPSSCLLGMKRFSIRVVCSVKRGEGSAKDGRSKPSYCSEAAGHVTGEGKREGGEGRRSPLSLPTVSIPDDLQKALKKVLERELIICHHPVIPISRDLMSSVTILTPEDNLLGAYCSLSLLPPLQPTQPNSLCRMARCSTDTSCPARRALTCRRAGGGEDCSELCRVW